MRRMVSLFVSAALLVVSSVPLVSAVACELHAHPAATMPEATRHIETLHRHDVSMHAGITMGHAQHAASMPEVMLPTTDMHAGHNHSAALSGDWQRCRIECGCGCHRSVDSLPHLLAPHSADSGFQPGIMASERTTPVVNVRLPARALSVTSPPPDCV